MSSTMILGTLFDPRSSLPAPHNPYGQPQPVFHHAQNQIFLYLTCSPLGPKQCQNPPRGWWESLMPATERHRGFSIPFLQLRFWTLIFCLKGVLKALEATAKVSCRGCVVLSARILEVNCWGMDRNMEYSSVTGNHLCDQCHPWEITLFPSAQAG